MELIVAIFIVWYSYLAGRFLFLFGQFAMDENVATAGPRILRTRVLGDHPPRRERSGRGAGKACDGRQNRQLFDAQILRISKRKREESDPSRDESSDQCGETVQIFSFPHPLKGRETFECRAIEPDTSLKRWNKR